MWNGIKPTHLWHKTGKKHMKNMLAVRESARYETEPPRDYDVRQRYDLFRLVRFIMGSAAITAYLFGMFGKPKDCSKKDGKALLIESEATCSSNPCPDIAPPTRPKKCPSKKDIK